MLGMTPSQYRNGGISEEIRFAVGQTSLGAILVASSEKGERLIDHGARAFIELLEVENVFVKRDCLFDIVDFNRDVIASVNFNLRPAHFRIYIASAKSDNLRSTWTSLVTFRF